MLMNKNNLARTPYLRIARALAVTAGVLVTSTAQAQAQPHENLLNRFNPAMSVILDGVYYYDNRRGEGPDTLEEADRVFQGHSHAGHQHGGLQRGFNLRETEITLSASVDHYFDGWASVSLDDGEAEMEEAWIRTRSLPAGLQIQAGRLLSALGMHNEKHLHSWHFADQNLAYRSLFGDHGLSGDGMRLTWLAPTATFVQLGVEALQGSELAQFGGRLDVDDIVLELQDEIGDPLPPGIYDPDLDGSVTEDDLQLSADSHGPALLTSFIRIGPDLGPLHALQLGLSGARHRHVQSFHETATDFLTAEGHSDITGVQAIYKRFATGDYGQGSVTLQGEFFAATGKLESSWHSNPQVTDLSVRQHEKAGYLEAIWGFAPRWQLGGRYAQSGIQGSESVGAEKHRTDASRTRSVALTWLPTEFSRIRLQGNRHHIKRDGQKNVDFNEVYLQFNVSLGTHGAHRF